MVNIIIDSGATKSEFVIFDNKNRITYFDLGINANYATTDEIQALFSRFHSYINHIITSPIQSITYYGAGCMNPHNCRKISLIIQKQFPDTEISVFSDLLLPCHALCKNQNGIVAILGSGAASCLYRNHSIEKVAPSFGYLLEDDGSGTALGRNFLKALLLKKFSPEIEEKFETYSKLLISEIIPHLYTCGTPQKFFASIPPFLLQNIDNKEIELLCKDSFSRFFANQSCCYDAEDNYPWFFAGSIAYHFRKPLNKIAQKLDITISKFVEKPLDEYTF